MSQVFEALGGPDEAMQVLSEHPALHVLWDIERLQWTLENIRREGGHGGQDPIAFLKRKIKHAAALIALYAQAPRGLQGTCLT